jgi:L-alanine-DL-glutamate epimerase-like enolase superfamily enzyme
MRDWAVTKAPAAKAERVEVPIEKLDVSAYLIPTDLPEADGTLAWNETTLVLVEVSGGGAAGLGYTYADTSTAKLIKDKLAAIIIDQDAMDIARLWTAMVRAIRNLGRSGVASMAISAVDNALWDLKARLLRLPLVTLLGAARQSIPIYGSGGFSSYSLTKLEEQLTEWVEAGIPRVKMKVGTSPDTDLDRVRVAREAIGAHTELFVDANGAYSSKQALAFAGQFKNQFNVSWFEEPVPSDDLEGLKLIKRNAPPGMDIAAGEYGYRPIYFRRMLEAGGVDVLQADASRCEGITGFLKAAVLCEAYQVPLSAHCAPSLHVHPCCAAPAIRHLEYFHDHARIEQMLFDGALTPVNGTLTPDYSRPGVGLEFKRSDAQRYLI